MTVPVELESISNPRKRVLTMRSPGKYSSVILKIASSEQDPQMRSRFVSLVVSLHSARAEECDIGNLAPGGWLLPLRLRDVDSCRK